MKKISIIYYIGLLGLGFVLSSCNVDSYTKLIIGENSVRTKAPVLFKVYVNSCTNSSDKNLPSNDLMKAKQRIRYIFPSSTYIRCSKEGPKNVSVIFHIPIKESKTFKTPFKLNDMRIVIKKHTIFMQISQKSQQRAIEVYKSLKSFFNFNFVFEITNNTNKMIIISAPQAFFFKNGSKESDLSTFAIMDYQHPVYLNIQDDIRILQSNVSTYELLTTGHTKIISYKIKE